MRWRAAILAAVTALLLAAPTTAATDAPAAVKLRRWYLCLEGTTSVRDHWDVFNRDGLPPASVNRKGEGGGFVFGRRFGGRFLLGLQLAVARHDMAGVPEDAYDIEALLTGTVLFRERDTLQPFVRGGFGAGGVAFEHAGDGGATTSIGTGAVAGGGLQVRLSSRFSLEFEAVAVFTNFLEVHDNPDGGPDSDWRVKTSNVGWRTGVGVMVWF